MESSRKEQQSSLCKSSSKRNENLWYM